MTNPKKLLWEILIPVASNAGVNFTLAHHHIWDAHAREISGGLTILRTANGQWVDEEDGASFHEKMIPIKLLCTEEEIDRIIEFTLEHYDQRSVLAYLVSEKVKLVRRKK